MKEYNEKLNLGKGSAFVKSRLGRLPTTDEVWEADIHPISVWGWDARHHGELWLGMVMTQIENFHLALLASEAAPGINDLATLLASAMERPYVKGKRRPTRIVLRNNPQWEELIPHLKQLKIEVITQQELPLWDDAAAAYVQRMKASRLGREVPMITVQAGLDRAFPAVMLATRIIPADDYLMTGGAGLPLDASTVRRIFDELTRTKQTPDTLNFHGITRRQEADIAANIIRTSLSARISSHIAYAEPGASESPSLSRSVARRVGRNDPCPCGSGRKFKVCCGRG